MAGLYIHIPFCRSKCAYCDFYSMPSDCHQSDSLFRQYCQALVNEFTLRCGEIKEPFTTIYIGGGTPTALPMPILTTLLSEIVAAITTHNRHFSSYSGISEFTVEANPEDITPEALRQLTDAGVNRISIGVQSFDQQQLNIIGRKHSVESADDALRVLKESGMNYSADLIYGLPGQSQASWEEQLRHLLSFQPPHFSSYLLSYEPGTRLNARLQKREVDEASETTATAMYASLYHIAAEYGYNHYEISNFAKPGKEAIHNSSYWNLTPYLGLGCSAHSFDGVVRRYNPSSVKRYIKQLSESEVPTIIDEENDTNRINDYIITSLRTSRGLSMPIFVQKWGVAQAYKFLENIRSLLKKGSIVQISSPNNLPDQNILSTENYSCRYAHSEMDYAGNDTGHLPEMKDFKDLTAELRIPEDKWLTSDAILREAIFL